MRPVLTQQAVAVSGHNGKVVFASDPSRFFDIYPVLWKGDDVDRVTNDTFLQLGPIWSPTGAGSPYAQCCNNGSFEIYADRRQRIGNAQAHEHHGQNIDPSYSGKGNIPYASKHSGNYHIWVMNGDGSHEHRITHDKSDELEPAWNLGGKKIRFE